MPDQAPRYAVFVHRCPHGEHKDAVELVVRKGWWGGPGVGGVGRELFRWCAPIKGYDENDTIALALEAAAAAMRGRTAPGD